MTDENLILFADDTSILLHDKNFKSLLDKAKSSLTKIQSWFLSNKLSLSIEKSHCIFYRSSKRKLTVRADYIKINGSKINRVKEVEYLGLTLDENMNWRPQLCSNVARYFSVFFNIRSYMPENYVKPCTMHSYIPEYNMELKYMGVQLKQLLISYMLHRINSWRYYLTNTIGTILTTSTGN